MSAFAEQWQAIMWTNDGVIYWHIHGSLGLNEFKRFLENDQYLVYDILKCILLKEKCDV